MNNLMIDLETYGNVPGSVILSVGAVLFDENGVHDVGFYQVVNFSSCVALGLTTDESTITWWEQQSPEARVDMQKALNNEGVELEVAFKNLTDYIVRFSDPEKVKVWGNGSDFDNAFMAVAAKLMGVELPWKFWNNRCFRTLKNLSGIPLPKRQGVHHNALADAIFQAGYASIVLATNARARG